MHIRGGDGRALVPVEKRMVLNDALQKRRGLGDRVLVVPGLRSKDSLDSKGPQVTNPIAAAETLDQELVDGEDFDDCEVFAQLLGEFLVKTPMPCDGRLGVGDDLGSRRTALFLSTHSTRASSRTAWN